MQSALLLLAWASPAVSTTSEQASPQITLPSGSVLTGFVETNYTSVRQFLGVPFAQPPTGNLRWEAPQATTLPAHLNATSYGRSCTQFDYVPANMKNTDVLEFNAQDVATSGEDCLSLSVWTPQTARDLPVIVFFYGGGWYNGGQNTPYTVPTQWVQRTKDLVVVVPKYVRLIESARWEP
jgi:cholinesterase